MKTQITEAEAQVRAIRGAGRVLQRIRRVILFPLVLGISAVLMPSSVFAEMTYQENPDAEFANPSHPLNGFYYFVTYNKAVGAIGAQWRVKHGEFAPYDINIPAAVWNADPTQLKLRLYSNSNNGAGESESWAEAYDGVNWIQLGQISKGVFGGTGTTSGPVFMTDGDWSTYNVWNEIGPVSSTWQSPHSKTNARWYEEAVVWNVPGPARVSIDIKPGSFPNSINPRSKGVTPVAILTTDAFDATNVDPLSVRFGPNGAREAHGRGHLEDANGDGRPDLVLHFRTQDTGIAAGATSASLTGQTFGGRPIAGSDSIQTVGGK